MTRHSILALLSMMLALWAFTRACNPPIPAESQGGPSATWAPAWPEPMGMAWLPVTVGGLDRDWRWDRVASAHADKATAAPTPTRTPTPTATRPARATRTQRPTGTPTQGRMATVPACGCDTPEPGEGTRFPGCWPWGGTCVPTETPTPTHTPYPRDTPYDTETPEPTPTPRVKATPVAGGWVPALETWRYYYPMMLVRARVRR